MILSKQKGLPEKKKRKRKENKIELEKCIPFWITVGEYYKKIDSKIDFITKTGQGCVSLLLLRCFNTKSENVYQTKRAIS